jgi:dynein heavy chain
MLDSYDNVDGTFHQQDLVSIQYEDYVSHDESFLEDINCILNSGEVPDLFDHEEQDAIRMELKQAAAQADIPDTKDSVYQFFISREFRLENLVEA